MVNRIALLLIFIIQFAYSARVQFAVFPIKNESSSEIWAWASYSLAEIFVRKVININDIVVWDPVFLNRLDSTFSVQNSDSLIKLHRNRWQWDVALGGSYRISTDSIIFKIEIIELSENDALKRMVLEQEAAIDHIQTSLSNVIVKILTYLKIPLTTEDSTLLLKKADIPQSAYQTYIAGYGCEMQGNHNDAITAYQRALEIKESYKLPLRRLGRLYLTSGNFLQAKKIYKNLENYTDDVSIAAEVADYYIETQQFERAVKYINSNRHALEATSAGFNVIGKVYLAQGEYQRAIASLTKAVAAGSSDLETDVKLGMAYLSTGDYNRATEIFNRLISYRPDYPRFYSCLSAAHRKAGRLIESSKVLESALKIDGENATILNDLAITYFELKWYQKAIQLLLRALENSPDLSDVYVNLAVAYWNNGERELAVKWLNTAEKYPKLRKAVYVNYGNMLYSDRQISRAIKMYHKARKCGGKSFIVHQNLANAYHAIAKYKNALIHFKECLSLSPNELSLLLRLADVSEKLQHYSDAENYYQKALEISPYHKPAINGLVNLLITQNKLEEAVKPLEAYLVYIPSDKTFMVQAGDIYRNMGWFEVAIAKFEAVIRDFPEEAAGYYGLGLSVYQMNVNKGRGSYEQAIYALKQASLIEPQNPEPDILIGDIYMQQKGYNELAVDHWKKALQLISDSKKRKQIEEKISRAGM